jgi:hypothetical protein
MSPNTTADQKMTSLMSQMKKTKFMELYEDAMQRNER